MKRTFCDLCRAELKGGRIGPGITVNNLRGGKGVTVDLSATVAIGNSRDVDVCVDCHIAVLENAARKLRDEPLYNLDELERGAQ